MPPESFVVNRSFAREAVGGGGSTSSGIVARAYTRQSDVVVVLSHEDATGLGAFVEVPIDAWAFDGPIEQTGIALTELVASFASTGRQAVGNSAQAQAFSGRLSTAISVAGATGQAQAFVAALLPAVNCAGNTGQAQAFDALLQARAPIAVSAGGGKLAAGRLNQRIALQEPVVVRMESGAESVTWVTVVVVWAEIKPISSPETVDAQQLDARPACDITIRWRSDVSASTRIVHRRTIYNVLDVRDFGAFLVLRCEREAASP